MKMIGKIGVEDSPPNESLKGCQRLMPKINLLPLMNLKNCTKKLGSSKIIIKFK